MKDKKKHIEGLAKVIFAKHSIHICSRCGSESACQELGYDECGVCSSFATDLVDAGYGDIKQALTEFAERLKGISCDMYLKVQLHACIDTILKEFLGE